MTALTSVVIASAAATPANAGAPRFIDACAELVACNAEKAALNLEIAILAGAVEDCQDQVRDVLDQSDQLGDQIQACQEAASQCLANLRDIINQASDCQDQHAACLANLDALMQQLNQCLSNRATLGGIEPIAWPKAPGPGIGGLGEGGIAADPGAIVVGVVADRLLDAICRRALARCEQEVQQLQQRRDDWRQLLDDCEDMLEEAQQYLAERQRILTQCQNELAACQAQTIDAEAALMLCQAALMECQIMTSHTQQWLSACQLGQGQVSIDFLEEIYNTVGIAVMRLDDAPAPGISATFGFVNRYLNPPGSGDLNDDGVVDSDDFIWFIAEFESGDADYNDDGVTDFRDVLFYIDLYLNG